MNAEVKATLTGFIKMVVSGPDGKARRQLDWFPNLVLNNGLHLVGEADYITYAQVGISNTPPVITDTGLHSFLAGTYAQNVSNTAQPTAPFYSSTVNKYRFPVGTATGNISEIGIGPTETGALFSRALALDGSGNPTTITVLSDEVLDVFYELRLYPPLTDVIGTITLDGNVYDYTIRACNLPSWPGPELVGGLAPPSNVGTTTEDITTMDTIPNSLIYIGGDQEVYGSGTDYRNLFATFLLDDANYTAGIGAIVFHTNLGVYQIGFSPKIPKVNTQNLTINTRIAWARHAP